MNKSKHMVLKVTLGLAISTSFGVSADESDAVLVVSDSDLDAYWVPDKKVAPKYPEKSLQKAEEGCVAVGYIIEPDGTTSSHRPVVSFPSNNFDKSSIAAAKQFEYVPSEQNSERQAVFTANVFTFQIQHSRKIDEKKRHKLAGICEDAANEFLNAKTSDAGAGE